MTAQPSETANAHPGVGETTGTIRFERLIDRVSLINRIHGALRSTLNLEDIYSIILSTTISRAGLGFSRAVLAEHRPSESAILGLAVLGANNRAQHEQIHADIAAEEDALANMMRDLGTDSPSSREEEHFFRQNLVDLSSHSFWITTYQKFSANSALQRDIDAWRIPFDLNRSGNPAWLDRLAREESALRLPHEELMASDLPGEIKDFFPGDTAWLSMKTQRGFRLLLIADKAFQDSPISNMDMMHAEWLAGQVSLALENAEMYRNLESAYQALKEVDSMKSNFLSTISHELRTPLTAIQGYVQLLVGNKIGPVSSGQKEVLERVQAHAELLTGKVNDLIEIAELDTNRGMNLTMMSVDPLNTLMSVLPRVEQRRVQKGISLQPNVDRPIPRVRANADALQRILFHLIDNAVKFGRINGKVRIDFDAADGFLRIVVIDDGIGISPDQQRKIFDAFYQIDNHLTRSYEGMGIGLAIIKKQLELTGGRIEVSSEPGVGSRFTVIYPIA